MFERFTERARQVVVLAQDESKQLNHNYIGAEHILLGLLREEEGLAARVLSEHEITLEQYRSWIRKNIGQGDEGDDEPSVSSQPLPFTPRAKRVLELGLREALSLAHNYVGTEHILLGLAREDNSLAMKFLRTEHGLDADAIRTAIIKLLRGPGRSSAQPVGTVKNLDDYNDRLVRVRASRLAKEYQRGWNEGYNEAIRRLTGEQEADVS